MWPNECSLATTAQEHIWWHVLSGILHYTALGRVSQRTILFNIPNLPNASLMSPTPETQKRYHFRLLPLSCSLYLAHQAALQRSPPSRLSAVNRAALFPVRREGWLGSGKRSLFLESKFSEACIPPLYLPDARSSCHVVDKIVASLACVHGQWRPPSMYAPSSDPGRSPPRDLVAVPRVCLSVRGQTRGRLTSVDKNHFAINAAHRPGLRRCRAQSDREDCAHQTDVHTRTKLRIRGWLSATRLEGFALQYTTSLNTQVLRWYRYLAMVPESGVI